MLSFTFEQDVIENNLAELSEWVKLHLLKADPGIFDRLDFEYEKTFLDPALIYHFLGNPAEKKETMSLEQILWGYRPDIYKPENITVYADQFGTIYLPDYGCYRFRPYGKLEMHWDQKEETPHFRAEGKPVTLPKLEEHSLAGTSVKLCNHVPELLTRSFDTRFLEPLTETIAAHQKNCETAMNIILQVMPELHFYIQKTCREIALFNSEEQVSMAALDHFGTAFLNVENQPHDEVFFIDDIAHQCGHLVFYALTLHAERFLKVTRDTPLKSFTGVEWEGRKVYGIFHGLFTYSTILSCLDQCLDHNLFTNKKYLEVIGRIGFYMNKFRCDIGYINDRRILTPEGFAYFDMLKAGYDTLYLKYRHFLHELDYSNQPYIFKYHKFEEQNAALQLLT